MRSLLESILGLTTAVWYDCGWFCYCSSGFGSDVRFFIARNADVTGDPVDHEVLVAVFHVCLNVFVQCCVVTMWIADVFNGTLAACVDLTMFVTVFWRRGLLPEWPPVLFVLWSSHWMLWMILWCVTLQKQIHMCRFHWPSSQCNIQGDHS